MATQQETPTTVHVKNISPQTDEHSIRDFFSFCGKIATLSVAKDGETQSASVTFEKPNAAKTALLLDNTQLGPNLVQVSAAASLAELSSKDAGAAPSGGPGAAATDEHVAQEDKPRSRIFAEYLAHGYTISDKAIERALALDKQHGVSTRFTSALKDFDTRYKASEKAQGVDAKYGVSARGSSAYNALSSYFEKAMDTPTGQKVRTFYLDGHKQVMDVHTEARRLADLKTGKPAAAGAGGVPSAEEAHMEKVDEAGHTKCNCGGADGSCPCEPGKCTCAGCGKNTDEKAAPMATGAA